jgi:hypothetical protein
MKTWEGCVLVGTGVVGLALSVGCGKVSTGASNDPDEILGAEAGKMSTSKGGSRDSTKGGQGGTGSTSTGGSGPTAASGGDMPAQGGADFVEGAAGEPGIGPGCVLDQNGMCVDSPRLFETLKGCSKIQLLQQESGVYALSTGTTQLLRVAPRSKRRVIADQLREAVTMAPPTAFTANAKRAFVAVGASIVRVALDTGDKTTLATVAENIADLYVTADTVYFISGNQLMSVGATALGEPPTLITTAGAQGLPKSVAYTFGYLIWASDLAYQLEAQKPWNGEQFTLAPSQGGLLLGPGALQVDNSYVYWVNFNLVRTALNGPPDPPFSSETVATPNNDVVAFAVHKSPGDVEYGAYVASSQGELGKVSSLQPDSLVPTPLARDLGSVTSLAVDDTYVFAATTDCNVLAVPR